MHLKLFKISWDNWHSKFVNYSDTNAREVDVPVNTTSTLTETDAFVIGKCKTQTILRMGSLSLPPLDIISNLSKRTHHQWPRKFFVNRSHCGHTSKVYLSTEGIFENLFGFGLIRFFCHNTSIWRTSRESSLGFTSTRTVRTHYTHFHEKLDRHTLSNDCCASWSDGYVRSADYQRGLTASKSDDYATALRERKPLVMTRNRFTF